MQINPYLMFEGRCEEALDFYKAVLGAEVTMLMRFSDAPDPSQMTVPGDKIMHASFKVGDTEVMASDGHCNAAALDFAGFALSLTASSVEEAERLFAALSEGGQVRQPMMTTFFAPRFGMLADKFGLGWMILAAA